jgi:simple sugar transport system substrate-binding protein
MSDMSGVFNVFGRQYLTLQYSVRKRIDFVSHGENLAQTMGGKGKYVGTVGALTMQTHNQWYNAAVSHIKANYPDMELVADQPYEDQIDATVGYNIAQELLKAHPDLGGYLGMTVEAGISMAKLLKETNNKNVKSSCLAMPSASGEYIKEGWISSGQCWRPADAGGETFNIEFSEKAEKSEIFRETK